MEKKRVIVDYSTLPDDVLEIMANRYPDGYDNDIIRFPNLKGELISAVRVETDTTIYLVKVSKQLAEMVEDFEIDDDDDDDDEQSDLIEEVIKGSKIPKEVLDEVDDDEEDDEKVDSMYDDDDDDDDDDK